MGLIGPYHTIYILVVCFDAWPPGGAVSNPSQVHLPTGISYAKSDRTVCSGLLDVQRWLWGLTLGFWRPLDREGLLGTRLEVYVVLWAKLMKHLFWAGHTGAARSE